MVIRLLLSILCYLDAGECLGLDVHVVDPLGHEGDRGAVLVVGLEGLKQGVITSRGAKRRRLLYNWNLLLTFLALGIARAHISVGLRRRGGKLSVYLSLFVLFYHTNFMNKPIIFFKN